MKNYSLGKIYKIISDHTDLCYVGSTCTPYLSTRMARHRSDLKSYKRGKKRLLCTSREIVKFDDAKIILIEMFPCGSKAELFARERYWIEILNCVNKIVPGRSDKEYREDNKERISKNQKLYREETLQSYQNILKFIAKQIKKQLDNMN